MPQRTSQKSKRKEKPSGMQQDSDVDRKSLPRGIADRLILEQVQQILPGSALLVLVHGTALAKHLTAARPEISWKIFTFEHFYMSTIVNALSEDVEAQEECEIELFCTPDLPEGEFNTILLPTDARGTSELTRDVLQSVSNRLAHAGRLIVSTNNPRDHWLHNHLKATFGRTTVISNKDGVCYVARKRPRPIKQKVFRCDFAFRDNETLIRCASRPGVFSHRRIDPGARALIRSLDLLQELRDWSKRPVNRIVEMGCGGGAVATAAALRYPDARVTALDSHARAIQSTEETAALNNASNVSVVLTSDGNVPEPGTHDLFLCNPPYYSDYRISELFLQSAAEALRPGGRLHVVTKLVDWHHNRVIEIFANGDVHQFGEYYVVCAQNT